MPSKLHAAYLAGIIDGEGSITISEYRRTDRPGYVRRNVRVSVYNTSETLLRSLQHDFGGHLWASTRVEKHWKTQFQLVWGESAIVPVLIAVMPYLRLKRKLAELALAYQSKKMPPTAFRRGGVPPETVAECEAIIAKVRKINKRGQRAIENSETS